MGGSGMGMLMRPEVQKELKLTEKQIQAIRSKSEAMRKARGNPGAPPPPGQGMGTAFNSILSASQQKRLAELRLQMGGMMALNSPETSGKLGITASQKAKIEQIMHSEFGSMRPRGEGPRPNRGAPPPSMGDWQKRREQMNQKISAILTPAQRTKWKAMLGKPFKMEPRGR